jgi:hypothetical protein
VARKRQVYSRSERNRRLDQALEAMLSEAILLDFSREEILAAVARKLDAMAGQQELRGGKL